MATEDIPAELRALDSTFDSIAQVLDPGELKARIARLSDQVAEPGLWDDPERAQKQTSRLSHAQGELAKLEAMGSR
ncbi:MAG: peptide chain release factor 2, partial [Bifidobacteriaceae bacterium]|nr:peptide chain release factor 2 [Bifidobacteriaceae bacterium]